jgi:hypothetical protein
MQESTVKVHVRQIMRKLGASNRTQAALLSTAIANAPSAQNGGPSGAAAPVLAAGDRMAAEQRCGGTGAAGSRPITL